MRDWHTLGVAELSALLRNKDISALELATRMLARLGGNPHHAFLSVDSEVTLAQAKAADVRLAAGDTSPLLGVPIAHKDIFVTTDFPTTAGSRMLEGYRSPFNATVVQRLEDAGMVSLGKLSCDEFAMGSANENVAVPSDKPQAVTNPWDPSRIPGGSSGGSAAAVAAQLTPAATGTDTGGSIRQPAAFCGITGIKPTYGRASRYMARSAEDCALLLSAMCGPDLDRDSTSLDLPAEDFSRDLRKPLKGLRVGVPDEFFAAGLAADVRQAIDSALAQLQSLGGTLVPIALPRTELSIPVYYIIAPAEASSNLSRFDGVKFGHRAKQFTDLADMYEKTRSEGFGDEVKRRIMIGSYVLSHGYYDAYYLQAQKIRRMIADDFQAAFQQCDVIAGPVAPTVAWKLGDKSADPLANYLADIFTLPASLAGLPGMSIPAGFGDAGMPVGMQLIGNYLQEARLLNVAHQYQLATDHHLKTPGGVA
ncbi:MAG: Asp-tRNA(Asn)/Glu-tRNA(Gln) amidotransferase subunit GatA [Betaproteobacteria bacterium]|nr:Asp-tRNA(Asn)/Glu-tRNA(Gln) amidotransferase subunit GatA [Betaproteobacteria bacterium]